MKSAEKPTMAPAVGPKRMPARKMGTVSMENRVASLGAKAKIRANMMLTAVKSAQQVRVLVADGLN